MKQINATFEDGEHVSLKAVKGDRTWREAIIEEFGISND
jgi:hypothetical protein